MDALKTCAEIDLNALSHNVRIIKKTTGNKPILAVVKAQAYGHGAVRVSKHLLACGASMLGVAFTDEAIELREAGIRAPIVVFFERNNINALFKYKLTPAVFDFKTAEIISNEASKRNQKIPVHIKVDTGMGRLGLRVKNALIEILKIVNLKNLKPEGIMSHFSDLDLMDKDFASEQLREFLKLVKSLKTKGVNFKFLHMANSAAVLGFPEAHLNMVRPGLMLYGYAPTQVSNLKPVMTLKTKVIFIKNVPAGTPISYGRTFITKRKSIIATLPIGYADGYNRRLSNNGRVLINDKYAPVVGRVCMDLTMVDVTKIPDIKEGDEVILISAQSKEKITAYDIAQRIGSIPYEVLTSIGQRVKRVYKNPPSPIS